MGPVPEDFIGGSKAYERSLWTQDIGAPTGGVGIIKA